ncbi:MAG: PilZ domain-containing protein [Magnetococcus sp. WYHC-3]
MTGEQLQPESAGETSGPEERFDPARYEVVVDQPGAVAAALQECLREEERLELQIGHQVRVFFTQVAPELPNTPPPGEGAESAAAPPQEVPAAPLSAGDGAGYLQRGEFLLLEPLAPANGNLILRQHPGATVQLRFFQRTDAVETWVAFQEVVQSGDRPALKVSFPRCLGRIRQRRHYRVRAIAGAELRLKVRGADFPPPGAELRVLDMSAGGMAFFHELEGEGLALETPLRLTLQPPTAAPLELTALVRNDKPATRKMIHAGLCGPRGRVCGVQFDIPDQARETWIGAEVARLQQVILARKRAAESSEVSRPEHAASGGGLGQLLSLKRKNQHKLLG